MGARHGLAARRRQVKYGKPAMPEPQGQCLGRQLVVMQSLAINGDPK
ncbi:MAG: hypothetical protein O6934_03625 [SAR324 cluster bacterium]|nr:hypothetical protein [SAR324 cluster bacterium]